MNGALTNAVIAVGITSLIGYALMTHVQNRGRRVGAGDGGCSTSDSGGGGDCRGDGGGGGD